jgi:hypothetical protein
LLTFISWSEQASGAVVHSAAIYRVARLEPAQHASRPDYHLCGLSSPFTTYLPFVSDFTARRIRRSGALMGLELANAAAHYPAAVVAGLPHGCLVVGLSSWNEFLFALRSEQPDLKPISTGLFAFRTRYARDGADECGSGHHDFTGHLLFLLMQRHFIEGLTQGGLKA